MAKHNKGEACRLPWIGLKVGRRWSCNECGARFLYVQTPGTTDRYGRKTVGHKYWSQVGG